MHCFKRNKKHQWRSILAATKTQFLCRILKFPPIQSDQWKNPEVQVFRTFLDTYFNSTIHCLWYFPCSATKNADIFSLVYSLWHFWNFPCETVGEQLSMQVFSDTCQRLLDAQRRIAQLEDQVNKETEVPRDFVGFFGAAIIVHPHRRFNFCWRNDKKQRSSQSHVVCGFVPDRMGVKSKSWKLKPFIFISFGRLPSLCQSGKIYHTYIYIISYIRVLCWTYFSPYPKCDLMMLMSLVAGTTILGKSAPRRTNLRFFSDDPSSNTLHLKDLNKYKHVWTFFYYPESLLSYWVSRKVLARKLDPRCKLFEHLLVVVLLFILL